MKEEGERQKSGSAECHWKKRVRLEGKQWVLVAEGLESG